tara:strand:- start:248 stop:583 length:336 start_codon:yes stop_codon:yes gene_type:complete
MRGVKITPYENCVIYCLESIDGVNQYIGGTSNFYQRKIHHKYRCNNITSLEYEYQVYRKIRATGGFENYSFRILQENINVKCRRDLLDIEKKYIDLIRPNLNTYLTYRKKN